MREHDLNAIYRGSSMAVDSVNLSDIDEPDEQECFVLMSLALDGMLDGDERARLDTMVAADPTLAEIWQQWSKVDVAFAETPRMLPAAGFTNRFETLLETKLARERTRQRVIMGVVATVVWTTVLVLAGVLLWFLIMNQGQVMGAFARETAYYGRAISVGIGALQSTAVATFSAPQSLAIAGIDALATGLLLFIWLRFLRRTTLETGLEAGYETGFESGQEER